MSVGRAFLPVPRGDSRFYLGSQQCESLLASLNESLAKVKIPFVGSGSSTLTGEVAVDLPDASYADSEERLRVSWAFHEGYRMTSLRGVPVRSNIPVWSFELSREGNRYEDVIWAGLDFCLIDQENMMAQYRRVTHNGMIMFHPDVPPGVYVPQLILPMVGS